MQVNRISPRMSFSAFELEPGAIYEVTQPFDDFDGGTHPVGERWRFVSQNFFPYDAGLTLMVVFGDRPGSIRLQDYDEAQGKLLARFSDYVRVVEL